MESICIKSGSDKMQLERIASMLKTTYWASTRSEDIIAKSIQNSLCFGVFLENNDVQVGFARVLTDYATTYYICDVVIDPAYRGKGLGKTLFSAIEKHMEPYGLKSLLFTRDAHGLYEKFGYHKIEDRAMFKNF